MSTRPNITLDFPAAGNQPKAITGSLPVANKQTHERKLVSDSTVLRVSTALQASLHVKDVVHAFASEIRRTVRDVSVRYRNRDRQIDIQDGNNQLHRTSYELTLVGNSLGEITLTRNRPLSERDHEILEVLLCALVYPLRNALLYEQAITQALLDPLTGINNRASMDSYLKHQVLVTERHKTPLSLIMIDVDLFKSVNDTFGHVVGDIVLQAVAKDIVKCTRDSDVVFRYGGEEFVVILTNTQSDGADFLAERIRQSVETLDVDALANNTRITVSAGVTQFRSGDTAVDLITRADEQLYRAKELGRNRVQSSAE